MKVMIIGTVIFLMGVTIICAPLIGAEGSWTVGAIFGGILALLGALALRNALPNILKAKTSKHQLLKAIEEGERDFLIWLYRTEIHVKENTLGQTVGTSNTLIYFDKNCKGKGVELAVSKKDSAADLYDYLSENFDVPYLGYNDKNKNAVNEFFGNKGWRKVQ